MISKGFKDKVKESLYLYYKIECDKFITSSDTFYYINARDNLDRKLFLTLDLYGNEFNHSTPSHFQVYIDGQSVVYQQMFMLDKIQNAMNKSLDVLKDLKSTYIRSLHLESRTGDYVLLSGGCSMRRSYLNITYTIPYSEENGFIFFGNKSLYKIAEIGIKNFDCEFKIFDEAKSIVSSNYLTDLSFNLKNGNQKILEDYILKTIVSCDLSVCSYNFTDTDTINFFNSLKYNLITYDNIEYIKDFYTVINMIKV